MVFCGVLFFFCENLTQIIWNNLRGSTRPSKGQEQRSQFPSSSYLLSDLGRMTLPSLSANILYLINGTHFMTKAVDSTNTSGAVVNLASVIQ